MPNADGWPARASRRSPDAGFVRELRPRVRLSGEDDSLLDALQDQLTDALADRRSFYWIQIGALGRSPRLLVSVTSTKGHVPLLVDRALAVTGALAGAVREAIVRAGL